MTIKSRNEDTKSPKEISNSKPGLLDSVHKDCCWVESLAKNTKLKVKPDPWPPKFLVF